MVSSVALSLMLAALTATKNVTFEILNKEPGPIWIGIQGDPGHPHLHNGGVTLEQGKSIFITAPGNWTGRIWPRTWCDPGTKRCRTGRCGKDAIECDGNMGEPPFTLLEFDLKGWKGLDYYYITLEQGYNLRASIEPIGGEKTPGDPDSCAKVSCATNINQHCANELKVEHSLQVIACKSACLRHPTDDLYCCRGAHDRPETCRNKDWHTDFASIVFKKHCPNAYSYKFDNAKRTFTCKASHYRIEFGDINN
ncbi:uncharacterized protein LOC126745835 [Anthonomus grandis grandis]|uniref:uncharacterized protein LOC126745835 n=1 Tax=Anthonomus grandis grandis TaxID=2921223 RepID=UPI0021668FBC|nr:uncharacterized protein LOC126745835 [Anthonomus grandis grandis]